MLGPDGFGGLRGDAGEITVIGGAAAAKIARWTIRRVGTNPDGKPRLRFLAHFSWKQDSLMAMCGSGELKARVCVFLKTPSAGQQQVDVVNWDSWEINEDGRLQLDNVMHFDTEPLGIARSVR